MNLCTSTSKATTFPVVVIAGNKEQGLSLSVVSLLKSRGHQCSPSMLSNRRSTFQSPGLLWLIGCPSSDCGHPWPFALSSDRLHTIMKMCQP